jgi:hypothetical protein
MWRVKVCGDKWARLRQCSAPEAHNTPHHARTPPDSAAGGGGGGAPTLTIEVVAHVKAARRRPAAVAELGRHKRLQALQGQLPEREQAEVVVGLEQVGLRVVREGGRGAGASLSRGKRGTPRCHCARHDATARGAARPARS